MSLVIKFYFTSSMLSMFRTLIHPSSGACYFSIVSPHWSCVLVSMCVEVPMWLGWGGIRVGGFSLKRINTISGRKAYILVFIHLLHYNNQCAWKCETKHSRGWNALLFIFGVIKSWWR